MHAHLSQPPATLAELALLPGVAATLAGRWIVVTNQPGGEALHAARQGQLPSDELRVCPHGQRRRLHLAASNRVGDRGVDFRCDGVAARIWRIEDKTVAAGAGFA